MYFLIKDVTWNKLLRGEIDQIWRECTMGYEKYKTKLKSMGWHSRFYFISIFRIYLYVTFSKKYLESEYLHKLYIFYVKSTHLWETCSDTYISNIIIQKR